MTIHKLLFSSLFSLLVGAMMTPLAIGNEAVKWRDNLNEAKIEATESGKLLLLHFYTSSCGPCRMLDENVFSQPQIAESITTNFIPVKLDADLSRALAGSYQIERVPTDIILNSQGNVIAKLSCPQNGSDYINQLTNLADHYRLYEARQKAPVQPPVQSAYAGLQVGQYQQQINLTQAQTTSAPQASAPAVTNNPYAANPANSGAAGASAVNESYASQPSGYQNRHQNVTLPANAMPNSYQAQSSTTSASQTPSQNIASGVAAQSNPAASNPSAPVQVLNPAAQVAAASQAAMPPQVPAGSPPLAFDGYCPVTLRSAHKWVAGNPKFGAIHRGRTFLFTSEEDRQQFFANPDAYCPVFSGMDPVLLLEQNQIVEGSRRFGFEYRGAFYLFASQESMDRFKSQPDHFAAGVKQAMNRMTGSSSDTVLR